MMLKEYRICMPLTVEEYRLGQLYMIAKHSHEQSQRGEGVEVVKNEACDHEEYGRGQYTEKRIYLSSHLPSWIRSMIPNLFYITERAWNYYPFTITEYTCSFVPRFSIHIETRYEDNNGSSENSLGLPPEELEIREVDFVDIACDTIPEKHYKEKEDCTKFKSTKTNRGPLQEGWRSGCLNRDKGRMTSTRVVHKEKTKPIMCSYKSTQVNFNVWGLSSRVETFSHKAIRDILLVGHRQAFAWIDEWIDMSLEDIRAYEGDMHKKTNEKVTSKNGD